MEILPGISKGYCSAADFPATGPILLRDREGRSPLPPQAACIDGVDVAVRKGDERRISPPVDRNPYEARTAVFAHHPTHPESQSRPVGRDRGRRELIDVV